MLKKIAVLLMLIAGVAAIDNCMKEGYKICGNEKVPEKFPKTAEELKRECNSFTDFLGCKAEQEEKCGHSSEDTIGLLRIFQDICDEDTRLFQAVIDNLKCYNELIDEERFIPRECRVPTYSLSSQRVFTRLQEEGHVTSTDDEDEAFYTYACIQGLQEIACLAMKIDDKCGATAKDTFLEILLKFESLSECTRKFYLLPVIIQLQKLEEEEANEVAEVLKRRK